MYTRTDLKWSRLVKKTYHFYIKSIIVDMSGIFNSDTQI